LWARPETSVTPGIASFEATFWEGNQQKVTRQV
jgi:hypothetical protein